MNAPQNTAGIISKATEMSFPKEKSNAEKMRIIVSNKTTMEMLKSSLNENAGAFTASVIDLYNSDSALQMCDPRQVFGECLKAASLKLPINKGLGFAYVVSYFDSKLKVYVPQFQLGYKGLIQLCIRTGAYKYINADVVYEGELIGNDKLTGSVDLSGVAASDKVIGYFAHLETLNGYSKTLYWDCAKMKAHVTRFSKSYVKGSSIWRDNYDAMCVKTVLRNLLSKYGVMSVDMVKAIQTDESADIVSAADNALTMETTAAISQTESEE